MAVRQNKNFILFVVAFLGAVSFLSFFSVVNAQQVDVGNTGLQTIQQTSGLGNSSIAEIVGTIIHIILTLLGVVSIGIVIYGGFRWMVAAGNEELITKAKKTLTNGAIGLAIVLASFGITQFILSSLVQATGTEISSGVNIENTEGGSGGFLLSGGSAGGFKVRYITPQGAQKYAKLEVTVVLTAAPDESSIKNNFVVSDASGPVPGKIEVDGEILRFIPDATCPAPNTNLHCFVGNTKYTVEIKGDSKGIISAVTKKGLACSETTCKASFTSGEGVDKNSPTIANNIPVDSTKVMVDVVVPTSAAANDDDQVAYGQISVDGKIIETNTPPLTSAGKLPTILLLQSKNFSTKGDAIGKEHAVQWMARDVSGNQGKLEIKVTTAPASCFNKKKDTDELDVDCGGPCGACPNVACKTIKDCANGYSCDAATKKCLATPIITGVQPVDGAPGTFVTIQGQGFGTGLGDVTFLGNPDTASDDTAALLACAAGWSDTEVVVQVPVNAKSGALRLKNGAGASDTTDNNAGFSLKTFQVNDVQRPGLCLLSPKSGLPGTKLTILGNDFLGQANVDRKLILAGFAVDSPTWGANTVQATVPAADPGPAGVMVVVKAMASNPLTFLVLDKDKVSAAGTDDGAGGAGGSGAAGAAGAGGKSANKQPTITAVKPNKGSVGVYVTISGANLGTTPSKVFLAMLDKAGKPSAEQVLAAFPAVSQCSKTFWDNTQVIIKIPQVPNGDYEIKIYPYGKTNPTNAVKFTVNNDPLGPQVCSLVPGTGPANGALVATFYGENFGTVAGAALFAPKVLVEAGKKGSTWGPNTASVTVPATTVSGEVRLLLGSLPVPTIDTCDKKPETCSNPVFFTVQDCRGKTNSCIAGSTCCIDGSCRSNCTAASDLSIAAFAWCIATGQQCVGMSPPKLVTECADKIIPSPSPSNEWPSTVKEKVCSNPQIKVKFTEPLDPETVKINQGVASSVYVEECIGPNEAQDYKWGWGSGVCSKTAPQMVVLANLVVSEKIDSKYGGISVTPKQLKGNTTYRVSLTNNLVGANSGLGLAADGQCGGNVARCFAFTTGDITKPCPIEKIGVSPDIYQAEQLGPIYDKLSKDETKPLLQWLPVPFGKDHCATLDPNVYNWSWAPTKKADNGFVSAAVTAPNGVQTGIIAKSPTAPAAPVEVVATELASGQSGKGLLNIDPGPPKIYEQCDGGAFTAESVRSPAPADQWPGGKDVCLNAVVSLVINQQINDDSLENGFSLRECQGTTVGKECVKTYDQKAAGFWVHAGDMANGHWLHNFSPETLAANTWYLAEIKTSVKGLGDNAKFMAPSASCVKGVANCFKFKTAADGRICQFKSLAIIPPKWNAVDFGLQIVAETNGMYNTKLFSLLALPDAGLCYYLKQEGDVQWSTDEAAHKGVISIDPENQFAENDWAQPIGAYQETKPNDPAKLLATFGLLTGVSEISVKFPTPTVKKYWPTGCGVCTNSSLGAEFSTNMVGESFKNNVYLLECPTAGGAGIPDCNFNEENIKAKGIKLNTNVAADANGLKMEFTSAVALKTETTYYVILFGNVRSLAFKNLGGLNYPSEKPFSFAWKFTTGKDICQIASVKVVPPKPIAKAQGEQQVFLTEPWSAGNTCHPEGQLLKATDYEWNWGSSDLAVATMITNPASSTLYFKQFYRMEGKGLVKDNFQTTKISATSGGQTGVSDWKLQCSSPPAACSAGTFAGIDKCCHQAPKIVTTYPNTGDSNICRNTLIYADADDALLVGSVFGTPITASTSVKLGYESTEKDCVGKAGKYDAGGYCFGAIPFSFDVINSKSKDKKDVGRLVLNIKALLPANKKMQVQLIGNATKLTDPAVRAVSGAPIISKRWTFTTAASPCAVDAAVVYPEEIYFKKTTDKSGMLGMAMSKQGSAMVPLSSIDGVYSWVWNWYSLDTGVAMVSEKQIINSATVTNSGGSNGETNVTGLLTIVADTAFKPSTFGQQQADSTKVIANLCEKPWSLGSLYPASPYYKPGPPFVDENNHYSFWYCRDNAAGELLPEIKIAVDTLSDIGQAEDFTTWFAYHLADSKTGGAIGVRIEKNLKHYSPLEWYYRKGFKGQPTEFKVDGFDAVRFGNTVYIGFGVSKNEYGDSYQKYTNILVLSLSEPIVPEMQNIFEQVLKNVKFVRNLTNLGLCKSSNKPFARTCNFDAECRPQGYDPSTGQNVFCDRVQSKFRRDTVRVTQLFAVQRALEKYKSFNGKYPTMAEGAFVPGLVSSAWPAWETFLADLGLQNIKDPLNVNVNCGKVCKNNMSKNCTADADCLGSNCVSATLPQADTHEASTCWSAIEKNYSCKFGAEVYHYQSFDNGARYELSFEPEQTATDWYDPLALATAELPGIKTGMCKGVGVNAANICGDKVKSSGEDCDPPGTPVIATSDVNADAAACPYKQAKVQCTNSCKYGAKIDCVNLCGDGIIESPEKCDEGTLLNGLYNHCSADCGVSGKNDVGACGDGTKQKNEFCDIGDPLNKHYTLEVSSNKVNGFVCTGVAKPEWSFLQNGQILVGQAYIDPVFNPILGVYKIPYLIAVCNGSLASQELGRCQSNQYKTCKKDNDYACGSKCNFSYDVGSKYATAKEDSCNWDCKAYGPYCGDGVVNKDFGEQCDGNEPDNINKCDKQCNPTTCLWQLNDDKKTITCEKWKPTAESDVEFAGCGDKKIVKEAGEECDNGRTLDENKDKVEGGGNGIPCAAPYGQNSSCVYCSNKCKLAYVSGGYCGDGARNGPEMCDLKKDSTVDLGVGICDPTKYDYGVTKDPASCKPDCTLGSIKDVTCYSCAARSIELQKVPIEAIVAHLAVDLLDPTLSANGKNFLPGPTVYSLNHRRFDGSFKTVAANVFAKMGNTDGANQLVEYNLDKSSACFENQEGAYQLDVTHSNSIMNIGGIFSYPTETKKISFKTAQEIADAKQIEFWPEGKAGDFRFVVVYKDAYTFNNSEVKLDLKNKAPCIGQSCSPADEASGVCISTNCVDSAFPAGNKPGYFLGMLSGMEAACLNNVSAPTQKVPIQGTYGQILRYIGTFWGGSVTARRYAGCLTSPPYAEIGVTCYGASCGDTDTDKVRTVVGVRANSFSVNGVNYKRFYTGVYQLSIISSAGAIIKKGDITVYVYHYDWADGATPAWKLKATIVLDKELNADADDGVDTWYPLYLLPDSKVYGEASKNGTEYHEGQYTITP